MYRKIPANPYAGWTVERLVGAAREQARVIESVEIAERRLGPGARPKPGPKGEVTPAEAVQLNRMLLVRYVDELQRRGVDTDAIKV